LGANEALSLLTGKLTASQTVHNTDQKIGLCTALNSGDFRLEKGRKGGPGTYISKGNGPRRWGKNGDNQREKPLKRWATCIGTRRKEGVDDGGKVTSQKKNETSNLRVCRT